MLIRDNNLNTYLGIKNYPCPGEIHHLRQLFSILEHNKLIWRALEKSHCVGHTSDQLNQILWVWDLDVSLFKNFFKLPRRFR